MLTFLRSLVDKMQKKARRQQEKEIQWCKIIFNSSEIISLASLPTDLYKAQAEVDQFLPKP